MILMLKRTHTLSLALGALFAAATASAQVQPSDLKALSLEELARLKVDTVYGASKRLQPVREAPASVTVITAEEIRRYGYRTLAEVLGSVRSFYTTYDRNYTYLGARGFGRTGDLHARILVLVNGHRLNDSVYDQALIGTEFPLDLDLIEKVEIIRGPASSLYGANALSGVVNVITKTAAQLEGPSLSAEAGSLDT